MSDFFPVNSWNFNIRRRLGLAESSVIVLGTNKTHYSGFLFEKLSEVLKQIDILIEIEKSNGRDPEKAYILSADLDTYFNAVSIDQLWSRFDCARNGKPLLFATEGQCYVGRPCDLSQIKNFYGNSDDGYFVFVNGGLSMGTLGAMRILLSDIVSNKEYYNDIGANRKSDRLHFDDQAAFAKWAAGNPGKYALDRHQIMFGMLTFGVPDSPYKRRDRLTCKNNSNPGPPEITVCGWVVQLYLYVYADSATCQIKRNITLMTERFPKHAVELSPYPMIFHGNGGWEPKALLNKFPKMLAHC
jgi:hypothetical protein